MPIREPRSGRCSPMRFGWPCCKIEVVLVVQRSANQDGGGGGFIWARLMTSSLGGCDKRSARGFEGTVGSL